MNAGGICAKFYARIVNIIYDADDLSIEEI